MKKFALLVALMLVFSAIVYADSPGHLDFPEMPFLSEAAVIEATSGAVMICFMVDLGVDDVEIIPDFKIRVLDIWAIIDVTDSISYVFKDGPGGDQLTQSFNTTTTGIQEMIALDHDFSEIDPAAGESIFIDATQTGTTAEGHMYIIAVRIL